MSDYRLGYDIEFLRETWERERGNLIVTIPSRQRCGSVRALEMFAGGVAKDRLWVVVEPTEAPAYTKEYGVCASVKVLSDTNRGVAFARQSALDMAREAGARWVLMMDDDLKSLTARTSMGNRTYFPAVRVPPEDVGLVIAGLIRTALAYGSVRTCLCKKTQIWYPKVWVKLLDQVTPFALYDLAMMDRAGLRFGTAKISDDAELVFLMFEKRLIWATWFGATCVWPVAKQPGGNQSLGDRKALVEATSRALVARFPNVAYLVDDFVNTGCIEVSPDYAEMRRIYGLTRRQVRTSGKGSWFSAHQPGKH